MVLFYIIFIPIFDRNDLVFYSLRKSDLVLVFKKYVIYYSSQDSFHVYNLIFSVIYINVFYSLLLYFSTLQLFYTFSFLLIDFLHSLV